MLLEKRLEAAMAPPVVWESDGESATIRWSGGVGPFSLQYALADDEAALTHNGGGPWKLAAAKIAGRTARKKNLVAGRRYAWRVKSAAAPNCAWSRACEEAMIPVPHPFMSRVFGDRLTDKSGGAVATRVGKG